MFEIKKNGTRSFFGIELFVKEFLIPRIERFDNWGQVAYYIKRNTENNIFFISFNAIEMWALRNKYQNKHTDVDLYYAARIAWNACNRTRNMGVHTISLTNPDVTRRGIIIYRRDDNDPYYKVPQRKTTKKQKIQSL